MPNGKINAIVGQSGGPTAAINATLAGVIIGASKTEKIEKLYGAFNGVEGILNGRTCDLLELFKTKEDIDLLKQTPAAALGSCRFKLPKLDDPEGVKIYNKIFEYFEKNNIHAFFYIGGNDSMDTVVKLGEYSKKIGYPFYCMGVPKTIDNDLCGTDHTPGFGSSAKYIATTMAEILADCSVYTVKSVTIVEIMGRDAGWLTAASALSSYANGMAPDYIYLPEVDFDMEKFYCDIEKAFEKHPNVVIAVSEGARFANGTYVGEGTQSGAVDNFGHKYLSGTGKALELAVKDKFGCKVRSIELNLPQRCAAHIQSKTDIEESVKIGAAAVSYVFQNSGCMMGFVRSNSERYRVSCKPMLVSEIANKVKEVPAEYINDEGNNVTEACIKYMLPLIQGERKYLINKGLPRYISIKRPE